MNEDTNIKIRISKDLKKAYKDTCHYERVDMSETLRAYIKKFVEDSEKRRLE